MELIIIILSGICIYLLVKNHHLNELSTHTPKRDSKETASPSQASAIPLDGATSSTGRSATTHIHQRENFSVPELDGPGMQQRIHRYDPTGHVCYLLYSPQHQAYKFGVSRPDRLASRVITIKSNVPDVVIVGTRVFTSRQNAYDAEQRVKRKYAQYKYHGIARNVAGRSEWITRRPSGEHHFMPPNRVEERYQEQSNAPLPDLEIQDIYTVYLVYSRSKDMYKIKWCRTDNLGAKLTAVKRETPDAELVSRMKFDDHHKAREVTRKLNEETGSFIENGRQDEIQWCSSPPALEQFRTWDKNGQKV